MSIGAITNDTVQQVNFNGGTDNVNQIDIIKNGVTTTVWKKNNVATFNVQLRRDSTYLGEGWVIGRMTDSYTGKSFTNVPTIQNGGSGYRVGGVYEVSLPATVYPLQRSQYVGTSFTTRSSSGGTAKPMLFYVESVTTDDGTASTTRNAVGAIRSGDFVWWPEATNFSLTDSALSPRILFAQKYTFTMDTDVPAMNLSAGADLYDVRTDSWTTIATAEDPEGIDIPTINNQGVAFYYNSDIRPNAYTLEFETYDANELQGALGNYGSINWDAR